MDDISLTDSYVDDNSIHTQEEIIQKPTLRQELYIIGAIIIVLLIVIALFSIGFSINATQDNSASNGDEGKLTVSPLPPQMD